MSEIDQQFVEYVVKSLVGKPDAVHIERRIDEKGVLLELTVDPEDLGRVIGKRGATAQSLRTLLRALGTKNDARYNLKIIDNGQDSPRRSRDDYVKKDDPVEEKPVNEEEKVEKVIDEEPIPEKETPVESDETDKTSDRLKKAREELADLDDLDV
ncbi:MAG TPA: KH domain-containing protein [Patescibacteria group bacterium]|nr:KH domain-containing protein [Patescibacteria group bacterium]